MSPLAWVAVLLATGLAVIVLEVFIPSGGILGFVSLTALVAALVTAFVQVGIGAGMAVLAFTVVAVPSVLALAFRWFPETPLGRRVLPPPPDPADLLPDAPRRRKLREMVGRHGLAVSELLPWGTVDVAGVVVDAMSESGPIAPGAVVDVVGVQGTALIVRSAAAAPPEVSAPPPQPERPAPEPGAPRLSPTLETFDFDHLDRPGA